MLSDVERSATLPDDEGSSAAGAPTTLPRPDTLTVVRSPDPPGGPPAPQPEAPEQPEAAAAEPETLAGLLERFHDERAHRRSVRAARLVVLALAATLLGVWGLQPPRAGGDENRALTRFPSLSAAGLLDGRNYRQADQALRDRLALRRYVAKAVGATAQKNLGTSLNTDVIIGAHGIPFLTQDFTLPCEGDFEPERVAAGLDQLRSVGALTGKSVLVAVAPDKSAVLTKDLGPRGGALMACADRIRGLTEKTWASPTSAVLSVWPQMTAAARKAGADRIFQHGDSHWTSQGALVWSRALISQLIAQGQAPAALQGAPEATQAPDEPADGDLYRLMGISKAETVPVWTVTRPGVRIRGRSLPSPSGHGIAEFHATSSTQPMIGGRTLIVNDSFMSRAEGQLAPYFDDLEVLHWDDFTADVEHNTLPSFDRIILETVQRGWPQRAGWLQAGQPVHDALAGALATPDTPTAPLASGRQTASS
jgi:hypothetical protein